MSLSYPRSTVSHEMPTLTGQAATEALQLYVKLGGSGSSFDAGKVARAVRTAAGRVRLRLDIFRSSWQPRAFLRPTHDRTTRRVLTRARQRQRFAGDAPDRPREPLWCDWGWE